MPMKRGASLEAPRTAAGVCIGIFDDDRVADKAIFPDSACRQVVFRQLKILTDLIFLKY